MNFDFIADEFKKIPQGFKYFFISGTILIFIPWLIDHWGTNSLYKLWGVDIREFFFSLGLSIILVSLVLLLWRQAKYYRQAKKYRDRYPVEKHNSTFDLLWFNGKLILFDHETKKYHHIYPYSTAQDLLFVDLGVRIKKDFEDVKSDEIRVSDKEIVLKEYKDGGPINTRI